jgi:hypothetical protein
MTVMSVTQARPRSVVVSGGGRLICVALRWTIVKEVQVSHGINQYQNM